ncbi:hypothetical protein [Stenotrophomonas maltophilia]|uniref:hypothetical protein n=1 Tax=Stenotrophomonas maltophilia TaxID=40324 RepID=UPI0034DB1509
MIAVLGPLVARGHRPEARVNVTTYREFSDLEFLQLQEDVRVRLQRENVAGMPAFNMVSAATYFEIRQDGEPVLLADNSAGRLLVIAFGQ